MSRFFNTTGPCEPGRHYMLPPERRLPELPLIIERMQYFVIHAARQTGKTTAMQAFAARLRGMGFAAVHTSLETAQQVDSVDEAEPLWMGSIALSASRQLPAAQQPPDRAASLEREVGNRLLWWLSAWSQALSPTGLVLLIDEADVVQGRAMVSLLRQLRFGFNMRPSGFPASVALIGMRDLRDYLTESKDGKPLNPGSPFNIKAASLTLRNFTREEVGELYAQHTAETGQTFEEAAIERAFYWTRGQPFLVNALADIATTSLVPDRARAVSVADIEAARERLLLSRTTHLDALAQRLREARVAKIVEAVILGDEPIQYDNDDFQYVLDLGLICRGPDGAEPANPLYREILTRQLTYNLQENLPRPRWAWQTPEGRLAFPALIEAYMRWWRENADALVEDVPDYPEAIPHLSFMAFLQRVVNGGGQVHREYAAGRGALDLAVEYAGERFVVEIKRVRPRDSLESAKERAIEQTLFYLETLGEREAWILLFDQRPGRSWTERLWREVVERDGRTLRLFGG